MNTKTKSIILLSVVLVAACAMILTVPVAALNGDRDQVKDQVKNQTKDQTCIPDCIQDQIQLQTKLQLKDCL